MMQDKALALTYTQIGGLTSILPVCYGKALLPTQTRVSHNAYTLLSTSQKLLFVKSMLGMQAQRSLCSYQSISVHLQQYHLAIHTGHSSRGFKNMSWKQPSSDLNCIC